MSFFDDTPILFALRVVLALIFVTAAVGQMRHWDAFLGVLQNYKLLPKWALAPAQRLLPLAEFTVGIGFIAVPEVAAPIGSGLLLVFAAAMAVNLKRGRAYIDCGCHQTTLSQKLRWALVVRNCILAALAVVTVMPRMLEAEVVIVGGAAGLVLFITYLAMNSLLAIGPIESRDIRISGI